MWCPDRYAFSPVADGLSFPTSVTFDPDGTAYVAECGVDFGDGSSGARVFAIPRPGERAMIADGFEPPVNGLTWHGGRLYVSDARAIHQIDINGANRRTVLNGLPGPGNYHTNMVAFGHDGKLYFSQGAMTNSGIVGLDGFSLAWLRRVPHAHDVPGYDIELVTADVETADPRAGDGARTRTAAFAPFGTPAQAGRRIEGTVPCTASIMRCDLDGANLELVAWGLRNAYGIGFLPDGRLLAIDQGADERGSRPIANAPDLLFEVRAGAWYGWPDFVGGEPVTQASYAPQRGPGPRFIIANHRQLPSPEAPLFRFPPHAAAVKFDVGPPGTSWEGCLAVALFGDERPLTAPAGEPVGRGLARIDTRGWAVETVTFAELKRPIDVRFHPRDRALHVLDFGSFEIGARGKPITHPGTGALWRLTEHTA